MLEIETCYTMAKVPYITYDALEEYGEALVRDFAPERLDAPGAVDVEGFVEYYLRLSVDYRQLCYSRNVLGMTAFNDGVVDVMSAETWQPEKIPVRTGTVIIDSSLTSKRNLPRLRFTMAHEGCHWLLHRRAFSEDNPFGPAGIYENRYLAAKEGRSDYSRSKKERSDIDIMERQADFLAAAILMPRPALRVAFSGYFKPYGEKPRRIVRGASPTDDCHAIQLPGYIAEIFNVSKRAALIRLEKLTAIADRWNGYR